MFAALCGDKSKGIRFVRNYHSPFLCLKRRYAFDLKLWFVCVCVCVSVCLSVSHYVCGKMAGLSNMVSNGINTIYKNSEMQH